MVFDNILSTERVDAMHAAFSTLLDNLRERDGDTKLVEDERGVLVPEPAVAELGEHGDIRTGNGRLQQVNRYTCNVPWVQPFADPEVSTRRHPPTSLSLPCGIRLTLLPPATSRRSTSTR